MVNSKMGPNFFALVPTAALLFDGRAENSAPHSLLHVHHSGDLRER